MVRTKPAVINAFIGGLYMKVSVEESIIPVDPASYNTRQKAEKGESGLIIDQQALIG
jgi:hypothetical protein